jgi:hypothetical protein
MIIVGLNEFCLGSILLAKKKTKERMNILDDLKMQYKLGGIAHRLIY